MYDIQTPCRTAWDFHTFLCKFWHFQMAVSCLCLGLFTPNLGILQSFVYTLWLCGSIVANPIIYRLMPSPSRFETSWSLISISCYESLIPRDVINHGGDKPWCVQSERYPIRGRVTEKQRFAQALLELYLKVFKNHLYYLWHVRVLSIKPCLHTQLSAHNRSYWKVSRGWGCLIIWNGPMMGHLNSFLASGGGIWTKLFQKFKCPGGCPGEMFKLRFDWYIIFSFYVKLVTAGLR